MYRALPFAMLLAWPAAYAGDSSIETITITAHRTPQPLERAGSAVTIVDRADIERRQATVAADALRAVPGLAIARSGPSGAQTQVRMRGAEANQLLVLIDGVEANDLATDDAFSFEHLTTFDIERIEVVRGPQSALWGSDALAGVINVVTRKPDEALETAGYLEGGSDGLINGGARMGMRGEAGWLSAFASQLRTDGTNAARSGTEEDGYDNLTAGISGSLDLRRGLRLDVGARHTDATAQFDANDFVNGMLVAVDADNETDLREDFARLGLQLDSYGGRMTHGLRYTLAETDTDTRSEDLYGGPAAHSATNGRRTRVAYQASLRPGPLAQDQLALAVEHEREEFTQRGAATPWGDPNQDQALHATGYAIEYVGVIGPDLAWSASARHDDNSDFGDVNTWRATVSWRLEGGATRLHGSVGTGQKSPTFFERFGYTPDTFVGNPDLEPETSTGWDAGIERQWLGKRLVTDVTWFRADLDDEINGFWCPPPTFACTAVNERGTSHRRGVEASAGLELGAAWSLQATYTYTDATQGDAQVREVRRPRHAASLDVAWRAPGGRFDFNAGASYVGDRQDDAFLLDAPYVRRVTLGQYTLVTLAMSYELAADIAVYGRLENALNEDYEDVFSYASPGRTAFLGVRAGVGRRR